MEKLDLRKSSPTLYAPPRDDFVLLKVPKFTFVKIDGKGDPNTVPEYELALKWLYGVSFWMKGLAKEAGKDYVVPPLEGLWWADSPKAFTANKRDKWRWTMMIIAPDVVGKKEFNAAVKRNEKKLGDAPKTLRFEPYDEGSASRSCTWAAMPTRHPPSSGCTRSSCRPMGSRRTGRITRSTSAIRGGPPRRSSRQSCGSR